MFLTISQTLLITDPLVWPDEATMSDIASNIRTHGSLMTNLFSDVVDGLQTHVSLYPPIYFYVLSLWQQIAGASIESVRWLSVILSIGSLLLIYTIGKTLTHSRWFALLSMFLVSIDMGFGRASRIGRMESLVELMICVSLYWHIRAFEKDSNLNRVLAGIGSATATLIHPIGGVMTLVLCVDELFSKKSRYTRLQRLIFTISPSIFGLSIWILSELLYLNYFIAQLSGQFADKSNYGPYITQLLHEPASLAFVVVSLGCVLYSLVTDQLRQRSDVRLLLVGFTLFLATQFVGKVMWYAVFLQPWLSILSTLVLQHIYGFSKKLSIGITIVLIIILGSIYNTIYDSSNHNPDPYHLFSSEVISKLPIHGTLLLTTIPDLYFDLSSVQNLSLREFPTGPIPLETYEQYMKSIDIVLVNFIPIEWFKTYLELNRQTVIPIRQPNGGYETNIVILRPADKRISAIGRQ